MVRSASVLAFGLRTHLLEARDSLSSSCSLPLCTRSQRAAHLLFTGRPEEFWRHLAHAGNASPHQPARSLVLFFSPNLPVCFPLAPQPCSRRRQRTTAVEQCASECVVPTELCRGGKREAPSRCPLGATKDSLRAARWRVPFTKRPTSRTGRKFILAQRAGGFVPVLHLQCDVAMAVNALSGMQGVRARSPPPPSFVSSPSERPTDRPEHLPPHVDVFGRE